MPVRRSLVFIAIVLLAIPFLSSLTSYQGAVNGSESKGLEYFVVTRGDVVASISSVGQIKADQEIDLALSNTGRVVEILVDPMDYVLAGDVLLRVQNDDQRIAYQQAVYNLELVEIQLDDLLAPVDGDEVLIAEAQVDAAYANYQSAASINQGAVGQADLQVQQAQAAYDAAIQRRIYGGDFNTPEDVTLSDAKIGEASFNLEIARHRAEDARQGNWSGANAAYKSYEQALANLEQTLAGPTELEIEQAEVRVEQAQAQLDRTEEALRDTELRAPFDGFITEVFIEPGSLLTPNTPVMRLVDTDPLSLEVEVDEVDIGQLEPGADAFVEVDALQGVFLSAKLERIDLIGKQAASGGVVNYDALVRLEQSDPRIFVGMTAEANFTIDERSDVLIVPNNYIRLDRRGNQAFVQLLDVATNEFVEQSVSLGLRGETYSEVLSGLAEGDVLRADLTGNQFSLFGE